MNMIRNDLSDSWLRNLTGHVDWGTTTAEQLEKVMDGLLSVHHPSLRRLIELMTSLSIAPQESPNEFGVRVQEQMEVGGIGSHDHFTLTWDRLEVGLILKGLPEAHRQLALQKYSGYDISVVELRAFLKTLTTSKINVTSTKGACNKSAGGKKNIVQC